ncbi:MAG: hypothetical protein DRP61_00465 [Candidatus Omnitrophota bacterium]|nr:MAG: hypothetical protein DRP61_00465 [Candidatus Omnitrophota bacterium]
MKRILRLTQELIKINSENPPGRERKIAKFCYDFLKNYGYKPRILEFAPQRSNLLCSCKSENSLRTILLSPHLDTVPAGENWNIPPFSAKILNNRIYGRGASDCKGNLAVGLEALAQLKEEKRKFRNLDIVFLATADEEAGSSLGFKPILNSLPRLDFGLILDGSEFKIIYAQKGLLHLRINILGKKAHGAYPERGENAIILSFNIYSQIRDLIKRLNKKDKKAQFTLNIGKIEGGEKVNMVADKCFMELDLRFRENESKEKLLNIFKKTIEKFTKAYSLKVLAYQPPVRAQRNNFWINCLKDTLLGENIKPHFEVSRGATILNFLLERGVEGVVFGFSTSQQAHATDEYIAIPNLYKGVRVLKNFLIKIDNILDNE